MPALGSRLSRILLPLAAAAGVLLLAGLNAVWLERSERARVQERVQAQTHAATLHLTGRLAGLQRVLRASSAFTARGPRPTPAAWRAFVAGLDLPAAFPGVQGLGYIEWVPAPARADHQARMRREGWAGFTALPFEGRSGHPDGAAPVLLLEPQDPRNRRAMARDLYSDPLRRGALDQARDGGSPVVTAPLRLLQEDGDRPQWGVLILAPVYGGLQPESLAERRRTLTGWTYVALRMGDFVRATLSQDLLAAEVGLADEAAGPLLEGPERPLATATLPVAGRTWRLGFTPTASGLQGLGLRSGGTLWALGGLLAAALAALVWSLLSRADKARALAEARSHTLREREARLAETEVEFRAVAEEGFAPLFIHRDGRWIYLNPAALGALGATSAEQVIGHPVLDRIHPEDREAVQARIDLAKKGVEVAPGEVRMLRLDGSILDLESHPRRIHFQGGPAVVVQGMDLAPRRKVIEAQVSARKGEALLLLAGGIAHDFNNIFQGIASSLDIFQMQCKDNPQALQTLAITRDALKRAVGLSWKMLDYSGRNATPPRREALEPLLRGWLRELEELLPPGSGLDLACEAAPPVLAEPRKLLQVLQALVQNAGEAQGPGRVRIALAVRAAGSVAAAHWACPAPAAQALVCLEVEDRGPGIPEADLGRIFDPFMGTKDPGRGLGLSAAQGILKWHRAGFGVRRADPHGAVFLICFAPAPTP